MSTSVFLSYARGDDEPFVRRLYEALTALGFAVWFDRVKMPSRGLAFPAELREAIDSSDRFLLVVGPKVATSAWCRAEWQHANVFGRPITPVVRMNGERPDGTRIDGFGLIPDELKLQELHADDFRDDERYRENLKVLVEQISEPVVPPGKLIGIPALPAHLLARHDRVQSLRDALLSDFQRPVGITGVHGMGGIGKSVLANLLARDARVRRAFRDGIVWVPIGIEAEIIQRQMELASALGYEGSRFESIAEGRLRLGELLAPKAVLLVLDDVWTREAAEAFNVLGPKCRAVLTTRDGGLVTSLGGTHYQLELLTDAEALRLLAHAAGIDAQELTDEARRVADRCGNLPLALALSGGLARRGMPWERVLYRLEQAALESVRDRHADPSNPQHESLAAALRVSLDALPDDERRRFLDLAVFPANTEVPEAAVRTLWGHTGNLDEFASEDLLLSFRERSLLLPSSSTQIAFHDLVHTFALKLAGEEQRLHEQILDAYRAKCSGQGVHAWATGPDDGYFFERLSFHLIKAGRTVDLGDLLFDASWLRSQARLRRLANTRSDCEVTIQAESDPRKREALQALKQGLAHSSYLVETRPQLLWQELRNRLVPDVLALVDFSDFESPFLWLSTSAVNRQSPQFISTLGFHKDSRSTPSAGPLAISCDGLHVFSGGAAGIQVWNLDGSECPIQMRDTDGPIWYLALSSDGTLLVAAYAGGGAIQVWSSEKGDLLRTLKAERRADRAVNSFALSPNGERLFVGLESGTVEVWNPRLGNCSFARTAHTSRVLACALNRSSSRGVTAGLDGLVCLWDLDTGHHVVMGSHAGGARSVCISPDERYIVSSGNEGTIIVWDAETGRKLRTLVGHGAQVGICAVGAVGLVISASNDSTLRVWDIESGKQCSILEGHKGDISALTIDPTGTIAASGGRKDGTVRLWDIREGRHRAAVRAHESTVADLVFAPDSSVLVSSGDDGFVRSWRTTPQTDCIDPSAGRTLRKLRVSRSKPLAITTDSEDAVCLWELSTGKERVTLGHHGHAIDFVELDASAAFVITGSHAGVVKLWDIDRRSLRFTINVGLFSGCAIHPNRAVFATAGDDQVVRIWEVSTGSERGRCVGHHDSVTSCAFQPSGDLLASTDDNGTAMFWRTDSWEEATPPLGLGARAAGKCVFSGDGSLFAAESGVMRGFVHVRDMSNGEVWRPEIGLHTVWSLNFDVTSRLLLVGDFGGLAAWDLSTKTKRYELESACFGDLSPDGSLLACWDDRGLLRVYLTDSGDELAAIEVPGIHQLAFDTSGSVITCIGNDEHLWRIELQFHENVEHGLNARTP